MVSPSEKLVSVRDAICWLLVLAVFCSMGDSLGLRCSARWKQWENKSQGGETHPPLITWDKACPILTYQQHCAFASSFTPELVGMCQFASPLFLLWIIFNFPSHLGWDKSTSLCGRVVRDEAAVSKFLLEFSLTCRPVYCSCCTVCGHIMSSH